VTIVEMLETPSNARYCLRVIKLAAMTHAQTKRSAISVLLQEAVATELVKLLDRPQNAVAIGQVRDGRVSGSQGAMSLVRA